MLKILEILIEGVVLYLLYKFVVNFVIPVYRSVKKARNQMKEIQEKMNQHLRNQQSQYTQQTPPFSQNNPSKKTTKEEEGEYIDYEEIK